MALGNNVSMGKVRGKNKPMQIKRSREYATAKNYSRGDLSSRQGNDRDACGEVSFPNQFYHNGSGSLPIINDIVYETKRARNPNTFTSGFYKMSDGRGGFVSLQINGVGVVTGSSACR